MTEVHSFKCCVAEAWQCREVWSPMEDWDVAGIVEGRQCPNTFWQCQCVLSCRCGVAVLQHMIHVEGFDGFRVAGSVGMIACC